MNKKQLSLLASLLLLTLCAGTALAAVHPSQQGDVGGSFATSVANGGQVPPTGQIIYISGEQINGIVDTTAVDGEETIVTDETAVTDGATTDWTAITGGGEVLLPQADTSVNWINNNIPGTTAPSLNIPGLTTSTDTAADETATGESGVVTIPETGATVIIPSEDEAEEEETASSGTQTLDWFSGGQDLLKKYPNIRIYDVNTGTSWSAKYINGKNHADIIPASASDAEKLEKNKITGSYVRRPILVTINGTQYAGSMYAVGHGSTSYCSYFSGVMCIHFTGSKTHGSNKVDSDHQDAISEALKVGN